MTSSYCSVMIPELVEWNQLNISTMSTVDKSVLVWNFIHLTMFMINVYIRNNITTTTTITTTITTTTTNTNLSTICL